MSRSCPVAVMLVACVLLLFSCFSYAAEVADVPKAGTNVGDEDDDVAYEDEEGMMHSEGLRPVVLWHGLFDDCCSDTSSAQSVKQLIEKEIPGIYVLSLMIGKDQQEDKKNSILKHVNEQIDEAYNLIKNDIKLKNGYNAVGFSQGALLLRALAQKYDEPKMFTLISLGGPQQGICGFEHTNWKTKLISWLARKTPITRWNLTKENCTPLQYWHDPTSERKYRKQRNHFIVDINNEHSINEKYKANLMKLQHLVLLKFTQDRKVIPMDSQWFEFYKPGQSKEILPLEKSRLWIEDRLGLKKMHEEGKLHRIQVPNGNLVFSDSWFVNNIVKIFLK